MYVWRLKIFIFSSFKILERTYTQVLRQYAILIYFLQTDLHKKKKKKRRAALNWIRYKSQSRREEIDILSYINISNNL